MERRFLHFGWSRVGGAPAAARASHSRTPQGLEPIGRVAGGGPPGDTSAPRFASTLEWLRPSLEAAGIVALLAVVSGSLGQTLSGANHALLCMTGVVFAGIRHGFGIAVAVSLGGMAVMSFLHLEPRFSLHSERAEDWITLTCFGIASFLTGNLAGRFRRQLAETRKVAEHNEALYEASRGLAATCQESELVEVLLRSIAEAGAYTTVFLIEDGHGRLVPITPLDREWGADIEGAAERVHREGVPSTLGDATGWYLLPLTGARGNLGVLGVRRARGPTRLEAEDRRMLGALAHSAAVALERCRLSEQVRATQLALDADKLRTALLSSVSHDLRTPLASIIGATSTLVHIGESVPPAAQSELLSLVLDEARRLDRLVANLLDLTRIEYGRLRPRPSWCDVRDLIAEVLRALHLTRARQSLRVSIDPDFPLLEVDAVLLERVIENLVDNAVQHAGPDVPIEIVATRDGAFACIRVIDEGPGLPRDPANGHERSPTGLREAHAFVRRAPGEQAATTRSASGIGLSICRGFVDALGGELRLRCGPSGRGLCAEVRLSALSSDAKCPETAEPLPA